MFAQRVCGNFQADLPILARSEWRLSGMRFVGPSSSSACDSSLHPDAAVSPRFKDKIHDSREIGKCPINGKDSAFCEDQTRIQGKPTITMIVALFNQRGPVGKTTLALHVADEWARKGKRVVLIDADPRGSALDWLGHPRIDQRVSYADVAQSGRLTELDPASPAACEISAVACEVSRVNPMTERSPMRDFAAATRNPGSVRPSRQSTARRTPCSRRA